MTFEEAFDYIRSLSTMKEDSIRELLDQRSKNPDSEYLLEDEDSGTKFNIRFTAVDGFTIDAIY